MCRTVKVVVVVVVENVLFAPECKTNKAFPYMEGRLYSSTTASQNHLANKKLNCVLVIVHV